ncbi:MAG: hypothetical protein LBI42_03000 [Chitinispirillales bacterium]|jgi:hypothetical protein|nr:hypothetical protein [Chitinispirillales bacterium]
MVKFVVFGLILAVGANASGVTKSTSDDLQSVEVTVYNSNMGLIKEQRKIKVPGGDGELQYVDVAAQINPVTVNVKPLANAADFVILEQNYEYDLISHAKLLDKYIGKKIKIVDWNEYKDRKTTVEAELLSSGFGMAGGEVYKIGNEIYLGHPGTKVLPSLPGNLISRPTLSWLYRNKTAREYQLEVSYITDGLNWNADYIFVVSDTKPVADLSGWVTVNNHSGGEYKNAKLKLIAGDVNRVQPVVMERRVGSAKFAMNDMAMGAAPEFSQSGVFEYHLYDLQRPTTIKDNQTKQINLLEARGLTVVKEYITRSDFAVSRGARINNNPDGAVKQSVSAFLSFKNTKENRLGNPLPGGIIRLYTADAQGRQQFIGEDRIVHTPKDEEIRIKAGDVFDLVAERKQLDFQQRTSHMSESEWSVTIRNRKEENVTVGIIENAHGNWEIIESSHRHTKVNATTFRFDVPVAKGKEVTVKYKIRVGI